MMVQLVHVPGQYTAVYYVGSSSLIVELSTMSSPEHKKQPLVIEVLSSPP